MNDEWRTKADQDLTAQDVGEMRRWAMANAAGLYKRGWDPADELPMAAEVAVHGTVRNDEPVAELIFFDPVTDRRAVHLSSGTAIDLIVQLAKFVQQIHRP